ncbi:hypothetical protein niasHS_003342 [Heterodera schachtii]|uniref:ER membrane protein complex subunit 1 n=1 Tax=Heterodera schachtii TaxID=97005 RepID=A0ABD2KGR6_HETSC
MLHFGNIFAAILVLFGASHALYLDQIGKFDWSIRHLGCPRQTWIGHLQNFDALVLISKKNVLGIINIDTANIVWRQVIGAEDGPPIELNSVDSSAVSVRSENGWHWNFDIHTGILRSQHNLTGSQNLSEKDIIFPRKFDHQSGHVEFENKDGTRQNVQLLSSDVPIAEIKIMRTSESTDHRPKYKLFVSRLDCSLELFEFSPSDKPANDEPLKHLWRRFEGLSEISDVQMVDLPLSEAQAQIETEFNTDESVWLSFLLRIRSQIEQLHRFFFTTANRFVQTLEMFVNGDFRFSALFGQLFGLGPAPEGMLSDGRLERDCFNMRKVIVVSTLPGTLFGISNENGHLLWSLYLGNDFAPYRNERHSVGAAREGKVPLLIQRGTAFYQWPSQAAAVFNAKDSVDSVVLFFNPITGTQIERVRIPGGLFRIELWPFPNSEQLHPLLILKNSDPTVVEFLPNSEPLKQTYLFNVGHEKGTLLGHKVEFSADGNARLSEQWMTQLPWSDSESIYAIVGKSANEKMHSRGKVLGNRSVLYKYNNPNLVAVLSADPSLSLLRLHLVDSVSGQLVFSGHYAKAAPPFHVVHCENWLLISYWNDKARRTEIGVVELFEEVAPQQQNPLTTDDALTATAFDSLATNIRPVQVVTKTYIFPQGISAMAATSTEQGLTSRAVLVALPFGGVLEISRRFLDARRPIEMTAELSEEMLIHYIPELPFATEDLINYNQSTLNVRGIRTAPSGLESTSLVFVYGLDLFYTRSTPSGTFDILKDDFDYVFIAGVVILLCVASVVCKRIWRYQSIQQAWA